MAPSPKIAPLFAAATGAALAATVAWQLTELLSRGRAHSFDAMLYARGLWGVAHGNLENPVLEMSTFAVHGHFLPMALLTPLAWVAPSAAVLIGAGSVAFGATAALGGNGFARSYTGATAGAMAIAGTLIIGLGTPLITNPFLFDIRPGLLGVPLATAALLRGATRGRFGTRELVLLALATLCREEFGLVAAAGILLTPSSAGWRARIYMAAPLAGWWAFYTFGLNPWLGGTSESSALHAVGDGGELAPLIRSKLILVALIVAAGGGFVLRGWRYAGAILPGLAMLMATRWIPENQVNFHYPMFVAPGLVVAAVMGHQAWRRKGGQPYVVRMVTAVLLAVGCFILASALPGGGRYVHEHFDPVPAPSAHDLVPKTGDRGLALPFYYGAFAADRETLATLSPLRRAIRTGQPVPNKFDYVIVEPSDWNRVGGALVSTGAWHLEDRAGVAVLLSRGGPEKTQWRAVAGEGTPSACTAPVARWPTLGLIACGSAQLADGRVSVTFARVENPRSAPDGLYPWIAAADRDSADPEPLLLMRGMAPLSHLPVGATVNAVTPARLEPGLGKLVLVDEHGQLIPTDTPEPEVIIAWGNP